MSGDEKPDMCPACGSKWGAHAETCPIKQDRARARREVGEHAALLARVAELEGAIHELHAAAVEGTPNADRPHVTIGSTATCTLHAVQAHRARVAELEGMLATATHHAVRADRELEMADLETDLRVRRAIDEAIRWHGRFHRAIEWGAALLADVQADAEGWEEYAEGVERDEAKAERDSDAAIAERDALKADVVAAAGELRVPIPTPGSDASRMLLANVAMRRERDEARAKVRGLEAELAEENKLHREACEDVRRRSHAMHALDDLPARIRALPFTPDTQVGTRQAAMREAAARLVEEACGIENPQPENLAGPVAILDAVARGAAERDVKPGDATRDLYVDDEDTLALESLDRTCPACWAPVNTWCSKNAAGHFGVCHERLDDDEPPCPVHG